MNLIIREATIQDAKYLAKAEQAWAAEPGYLVSQPNELSVENYKKKINDLKQKQNGIYIVAELDDEIVAHALLDPMGLQSIKHIVRLTIVVHKGFEAKRIGGQIMDYLIDWAKENMQVDKIELNVRATNERAIRLYESKGFVKEGLLKNRIKISSGEYIDELLMGLMVVCP